VAVKKRIQMLRLDDSLRIRNGHDTVANLDYGFREWSTSIEDARQRGIRLVASWNALRKWSIEEIEAAVTRGVEK